jgi:lipopolysaccharide/colanic/teichoic acid biosynthesis glycosyltransferase
MTTTVLLALFIAIVGRLMADEVKAWFCWLHKRIRRRAVAKLPEEYRERYDEEWESGMEEAPGELFKLIYSIGLLRASAGICKAVPNAAAKIRTYYDRMKRDFDIVFAGIALVVTVPLFILIAIAIKLDSPGPIFYSSERIGKKGVVFRAIKFRTLASDAETWNFSAARTNEPDDVMPEATDDLRVTKLGRFLRRYSLDEFPQFFNVLRGDMSIVGPRPPIVGETRKYKLSDLERLHVPPGITGTWLVQDRRDPPSENDPSPEVTYVNNRSFWLDLKIIARTIELALFGTNSGLSKDTLDSANKND